MNLSAHVRIPDGLTDAGKRGLALSMMRRGHGFVGAAFLLKRENGDGYVWLHLLCQGIEIICKSLLLLHDFDGNYSKLSKKYGHKLTKCVMHAGAAYGCHDPRGAWFAEFQTLAGFYERHWLRYETGFGLFVDPSTIPTGHLRHRVFALIRLLRMRGLV
jgi:hypothetical protein